MKTGIIAAIVIITVLVVLLLFTVMVERVIRNIAVLRHVYSRYATPVADLTEQWERISAWQPGSGEAQVNPTGLRHSADQGYTGQNDT